MRQHGKYIDRNILVVTVDVDLRTFKTILTIV